MFEFGNRSAEFFHQLAARQQPDQQQNIQQEVIHAGAKPRTPLADLDLAIQIITAMPAIAL